MEEIRNVLPTEAYESARLYAYAFKSDIPERRQAMQDEEGENAQHTARNRRNFDNLLGFFHNGKLAAQIVVNRLHAYVQGRSFAMGGIGGVASWPEFRRKGMVGRLMVHSLQFMRDRGETLSYLAPFSYPFYRRYGWELALERKSYTVPTSHIPRFKDDPGRIERVELPDDWEVLNKLYHPYAKQFSGMVVRSEESWVMGWRFKNKYAIVRYDANDEPDAYLIYDAKSSEMNVIEFVYLNEVARKSVWNFIANHDSMFPRVKLLAPVDDPLPFLMDNPWTSQEINPFFMTRVVDVAAFLRQYAFAADGADQTFYWTIQDEYAPWNDGTFKVCVRGGEAEVSMVDVETVENELLHLKCTIQTFSAMMVGYIRPSKLVPAGRLTGSDEAVKRWEQLVPPQTPFVLDSF